MSPTNHDASKVLMGSTQSSDKVLSCEPSDPATFKAGLAVRRDDDGTLSLADGELIGVSAGKSLSDTKKTAVVRAGNRVPLQLTDEGEFASLVVGDLTYTAVAKGEDGNEITIAQVDDADAGDETIDVDGSDIVVHMEDGASTAQQIADAVAASEEASALVGVTIATGEESTAQSDAAEDNLEGGLDSYPYAVVGDPVLVDATSGKASSDGDPVNAVYETEAMTGVQEDATETSVALVDMAGGL